MRALQRAVDVKKAAAHYQLARALPWQQAAALAAFRRYRDLDPPRPLTLNSAACRPAGTPPTGGAVLRAGHRPRRGELPPGALERPGCFLLARAFSNKKYARSVELYKGADA